MKGKIVHAYNFKKQVTCVFYKIDSIPSPEISATPILQSPVFFIYPSNPCHQSECFYISKVQQVTSGPRDQAKIPLWGLF